MEVQYTLQWYPASTMTWWTHMCPKLWHMVTSNKQKKCLSATMWPLPTYKVYQTPLLCIDWMWYEFQVGGVMRTSNTKAMPSVSPTLIKTTTDMNNMVGLHSYDCPPENNVINHFLYIYYGNAKCSILYSDTWPHPCHGGLIFVPTWDTGWPVTS